MNAEPPPLPQPLIQTEALATSTPIVTPVVVRPEKPERNLWREQEMLTVLQIIREKKFLPLLNDKTVRSETVFRKVEKEMNDRGFCKKNFQQIWTKWKFLKSTYMTSRRIHQIPKIIPLDVYESLDELLSAEFQNDGCSVSSYEGCGGGGGGGGSGVDYEDGGMSSYEMKNASTGSNDGLVIANVEGGVPYNGTRNYSDLNGFGGGLRKKFKNGFRSMKCEDETSAFGMQHPIFGYRLGVVKDEPFDDGYENNNNGESSYTDIPMEDQSNSQQYPEVKAEQLSPPHSPSPTTEEDHLPQVPVMPITPLSSDQPSLAPILNCNPINTTSMPPLHRFTPPPFVPTHQSDQPILPPPLKQMPLIKISLPPKPTTSSTPQIKRPSPPKQTPVNSKKIPVLTLRKRKKRLHIPELSEDTESLAPSSKHSKCSEEDESTKDTTPSESSRIPFVTYGKAMREMTISLRDIQREMIDDFFKQQMDLAKSDHEFQKQQDAMLLKCFQDQTKLLLDGVKRFLTNGNKN